VIACSPDQADRPAWSDSFNSPLLTSSIELNLPVNETGGQADFNPALCIAFEHTPILQRNTRESWP
jgi:hypothetical protein